MMICFCKTIFGLMLMVLIVLLAPSIRAQDTAIIITPTVSVASPGELFEVHVALDSSVTDVMFYVVHLRYDTSIVRYVDAWPDQAWSNLSDAGTAYFQDSIVFEEDPLSGDTIQYLSVFDIIWSGMPKKTIGGYSEIATLQFEAVANGATHLFFDVIMVKDPNDNIVVENVMNGMLYVCPLPPKFEFAGDLNGTNTADIVDLTYFVEYMFGGGPPPLFNLLTADLNCDFAADIVDLTYFVEYMFGGGPKPCSHCP